MKSTVYCLLLLFFLSGTVFAESSDIGNIVPAQSTVAESGAGDLSAKGEVVKSSDQLSASHKATSFIVDLFDCAWMVISDWLDFEISEENEPTEPNNQPPDEGNGGWDPGYEVLIEDAGWDEGII